MKKRPLLLSFLRRQEPSQNGGGRRPQLIGLDACLRRHDEVRTLSVWLISAALFCFAGAAYGANPNLV
jgi:hypothetical protein